MALLGPSCHFPSPGCRALGPQPRAAPAGPIAPSLPPGVGRRSQRAARRHFLLRHAGLSALSRARGRSLCCPPPTHSPHSFPAHAVRRSASADFSKIEVPGPGGGCPSASCLLPQSAPGPRCRGQRAAPRGSPSTADAVPCAGRGARTAAGGAGASAPSGPSGRMIAPRGPGSPGGG